MAEISVSRNGYGKNFFRLSSRSVSGFLKPSDGSFCFLCFPLFLSLFTQNIRSTEITYHCEESDDGSVTADYANGNSFVSHSDTLAVIQK